MQINGIHSLIVATSRKKKSSYFIKHITMTSLIDIKKYMLLLPRCNIYINNSLTYKHFTMNYTLFINVLIRILIEIDSS